LNPPQRILWIFTLATFVLVLLLSLNLGAVSGASSEIVVQLRVPRVLGAIGVGAALALAGALLQAIFANPLCEPYTLGVSSGGAVGAVLGSVLGLGWSPLGLSGASFLGAGTFVLILLAIGQRLRFSSTAVLLSGVMLGFLGSSLVAIAMVVSDPQGLQGALFWLLGDLSRMTYPTAILVTLVTAVFGLLAWVRAKDFDVLLFGEQEALGFGVDPRSTRRFGVLVASLVVGVSVGTAGMIGFIGLIVPHLVRRAVGSFHANVLPLSLVWGSTVLMASDLIARSVAAPLELPVGVMTAFLGAPAFLWIFLGRSSRWNRLATRLS
jgi:ABC-type Fe3+-siderophore transport system permease subunit